jgi:hypothetical protein
MQGIVTASIHIPFYHLHNLHLSLYSMAAVNGHEGVYPDDKQFRLMRLLLVQRSLLLLQPIQRLFYLPRCSLLRRETHPSL